MPHLRFGRIDLGTSIEQGADGIESTGPHRSHQHGVAADVGAIRVGTGGHQPADYRRIAKVSGQVKRCHAVAACSLDVRASANQRIHCLDVVGANRPMQRGRPVDCDGVDVGFLLNIRGDGFGVTRPRRAHLCRIVCGLDGGDGGDDEEDRTRSGNESLHSAQL